MPKNQELTKIISEIKFRRGLNQQEIAKELGLSAQYLSDLINSRYELTDKVRNLLYDTYSDILTGEGEMLKEDVDMPKVVATNNKGYADAKKYDMILIPEYDAVYHAGSEIVSEPDCPVAHWSIPQAPRHSYIVSMVGNSMSPLLMSGGKLLVKPCSFSSSTDIPFGNVFAITVSDEWGDIYTHIKILRRHTDPKMENTHWIARSVNQEYDDFDIRIANVQSLAIVVMDINQRISVQ